MSDFYRLTVTDIDRDTRDATIVSLRPTDQDRAAFKFNAGQYLTFRRDFDGKEARRSYSICVQEGADALRVGVKKVAGGLFSTYVNEKLNVGDTLEAMAPAGKFGELDAAVGQPHYLCVSAGSGITPVLSIIKTRLEAEPDARVTLVYGNRSSASIMFREVLEDLKNQYLGRLNLVHVLSREQQEIDLFNGRIDQDKCAQLFKHWVSVEHLTGAFVCGPFGMMEAVREALRTAGVANEKIRLELFAADEGAARQRAAEREVNAKDDAPAHTAQISINGLTTSIEVQSQTETILDAGLRAGLELPFSCKGGVCSTCMAKLMEGEVEMDANYALEDYELARGYILCCQSYPVTERVVVEYDQ